MDCPAIKEMQRQISGLQASLEQAQSHLAPRHDLLRFLGTHTPAQACQFFEADQVALTIRLAADFSFATIGLGKFNAALEELRAAVGAIEKDQG